MQIRNARQNGCSETTYSQHLCFSKHYHISFVGDSTSISPGHRRVDVVILFRIMLKVRLAVIMPCGSYNRVVLHRGQGCAAIEGGVQR